MRIRMFVAIVFLVTSLVPGLRAQQNKAPGMDISLGMLGGIRRLTRVGDFPQGTAAFAMSTTACNVGTVDVGWHAPMNPDHPCIAFLVVRVTDDRIEQISDRSYIKHGFFAVNDNFCSTCQNPSPNGTWLGVGCSDTYAVHNNANNRYLGPPEEVDPWTGIWEPICSHFDQGEPPVAPPNDCNGVRDFIKPADAAGHRIRIRDQELLKTGTFAFQAYYMITKEPSANRENNYASRTFTVVWNGVKWVVSIPSRGGGNVELPGTILQRWPGATISAAGQGEDDGLVFLAEKTFNLGNGLFRYEYAIHNRDNARAIGSLRIPLCPGATITKTSFRDNDTDPGNTWRLQRGNDEVIFSTTNNPVRWNSIYNFSIECDVPPTADTAVLVTPFESGAGGNFLALKTEVPMGGAGSSDLGFATVGGNGLAPELRACGDLSSNHTGQMLLRFGAPHAMTFLVASTQSQPVKLFNGTLVPFPIQWLLMAPTTADGSLRMPIPGGRGPLNVYLQALIHEPNQANPFTFSNALLVPLLP